MAERARGMGRGLSAILSSTVPVAEGGESHPATRRPHFVHTDPPAPPGFRAAPRRQAFQLFGFLYLSINFCISSAEPPGRFL